MLKMGRLVYLSASILIKANVDKIVSGSGF